MHVSTSAATIAVKLVYLARLREAFDTTGENLVLTVEGEQVTVADVLAALIARGGAWALELAPGRAVRVAVNYVMVGRDAPLRAGDEVAIFPPVTGG